MNNKILLIALSVAVLSSCSTAYKTGQTPDDVYYSPARSYAVKEIKEDRNEDRDDYYSYEDRQIRMGINNARWRYLDYDMYNYNPYYYGYNTNYYYNPYYYPYPVYHTGYWYPNYFIKPIAQPPVRITNLNTYSNTNYSNNNNRSIKINGVNQGRTYNNSNNSYKPAKTRSVDYSVPNDNNNSGNSNRTYTPTNNNNNSSSGSGSSGRGSSRPTRGN